MAGFDTPKNLMSNEVINMLIDDENNLFDNNDGDELLIFQLYMKLYLVQSYEWYEWCS